MKLPDPLQHLKNIIEAAKVNLHVDLLRDVIKAAANEMPDKDVILVAEWILKRGIEIEESKNAGKN